jgi:pimeloyl-ACP methyl ester carboxylesterase
VPRTLIVHDVDDRSAPIEGARALAGVMPQVRLVETRLLGHRQLVRDDGVMAEVADFRAGRAA